MRPRPREKNGRKVRGPSESCPTSGLATVPAGEPRWRAMAGQRERTFSASIPFRASIAAARHSVSIKRPSTSTGASIFHGPVDRDQ